MKSTHQGTCQVCGRMQALPSGRLSKHGYDVKFHYFHGVCPGAGHKPLEIERTFADEVAASLLVSARKHVRDADAVVRGKLLPKLARSGKTVKDAERGWGTRDEMIPYADATDYYQLDARKSLELHHRNTARVEKAVSCEITARADKTTGKAALVARVEEAPRKELAPGVKFKLFGKERVALRVENRTAHGCGPYLNGNVMPHVVYALEDGRELAYPTRLIRQSAIL